MEHKRLTLFAGHYGSGKTNIAVNYALHLAKEGKKVCIADLDIVNPYFRTKDSAKELEEAAWIDGLGPFQTFLRIVVPSSGVVFMTVTILSVVWHWNEYFLPSTYLTENYPLAVKIYNAFSNFYIAGYNHFSGEVGNAVMATCFVFLLPMLIMYLILQKQFINSMTQSGIKG